MSATSLIWDANMTLGKLQFVRKAIYLYLVNTSKFGGIFMFGKKKEKKWEASCSSKFQKSLFEKKLYQN